MRVGARYVFPDTSLCLARDLPDAVALGTKPLEEKAGVAVPGEGFHAPGLFGLAPGCLGPSFATAFTGLQEGTLRIADFTASKCSTYQRW